MISKEMIYGIIHDVINQTAVNEPTYLPRYRVYRWRLGNILVEQVQ
jgi:hypothetical protein